MNIYNRENEIRRKIYSKILKKRSQKSSTRLCNGVIVRKWMQNKSHHHVHESRTFSERLTWCKQKLTPSREAFTKSRHELIPGHSPQTLTVRIVKKLYPRDPKHIATSCGVIGMRVPQTRVKKKGTERSIPCMLE